MSTTPPPPRKVTLYQVLGLAPGATEEAIRAAYKSLARKYHPDLNQGNPKAELAFKAVGRAYEVLSNPEKRRLYDEALEAESDHTEEADLGNPRGPGQARKKERGREWVPALFGILVVLSVIFFFFDTAKGLYFLVIAVALEIRTAIEAVRVEARR